MLIIGMKQQQHDTWPSDGNHHDGLIMDHVL